MATPEQLIAAEVVDKIHKETVRDLRDKSEAFDQLKGPEARSAYLLYRHAAQILDSMNWSDIVTMVIANDQASDQVVAERVKRRVDASRKRKTIGLIAGLTILIGGCRPPVNYHRLPDEELLRVTRVAKSPYATVYKIEVEPGKFMYLAEGDASNTPVSMVIDKESHETPNPSIPSATP